MAAREDIERFLAYLAEPAHRDEYRRPCNRTALRSDSQPDTCIVKLTENVQVTFTETSFQQGGLGYRIFPASMVLSCWLADHGALIAGARVLELGAGLGVPGFACAQLGAARVVLSDYLPALLDCLQRGAELNCPVHVERRVVGVRMLDWAEGAACVDRSRAAGGGDAVSTSCAPGEGSHRELRRVGGERFDVIIGADILYEPEYAHWLPRVVTAHLRARAADCPRERPSCLFVAPTRTLSILTVFVNNLYQAGLRVHVVSAADPRRPVLRRDGPGRALELDAEEGTDCLLIFGWLPCSKPK